MPINPVIFVGYLRHKIVFAKYGNANHKLEKNVKKDELVQGLKSLGLNASDDVLRKAAET